MANTEELGEGGLSPYYRNFHIWLKDFEETSSYADLVNAHDRHWIKIFKELDQIFNDTVWIPMRLRNEAPIEETSSDETSSDEDEEDDPMLRIDASQQDNYRRQQATQ